ncbi:MAG: aspartate transaminase, partial [Candidatus Omnitrophica bacterium]|nr:aspartate transaminase [Candidatus Omnitrophota bacterium]
DVTPTGLSALEFADQLLKQQMVSCIPAESFGIEGYIRLSFATGNGQIKKGVARITDFLNGI